MADGKVAQERRTHSVGWESADWDRIEECGKLLTTELHLDIGATDVIRTAVRRFCDEKLGPVVR